MRSQDDAESGRITGPQPAQPRSTDDRRPDLGFESRPTLVRRVFVKGDVTGSEDMMVDSELEGRIHLPDHTLTIGPNATIRADITAKAVTIFGTVIGSITAGDRVDVRLSGFVKGNVVCRRLAVQSGANLNGRIETRGDCQTGAAETADSEAAPLHRPDESMPLTSRPGSAEKVTGGTSACGARTIIDRDESSQLNHPRAAMSRGRSSSDDRS